MEPALYSNVQPKGTSYPLMVGTLLAAKLHGCNLVMNVTQMVLDGKDREAAHEYTSFLLVFTQAVNLRDLRVLDIGYMEINSLLLRIHRCILRTLKIKVVEHEESYAFLLLPIGQLPQLRKLELSIDYRNTSLGAVASDPEVHQVVWNLAFLRKMRFYISNHFVPAMARLLAHSSLLLLKKAAWYGYTIRQPVAFVHWADLAIFYERERHWVSLLSLHVPDIQLDRPPALTTLTSAPAA